MVARKLGYKRISIGDLRGRIAMKHCMTIDELNEIGKKEIWTDKEVDDELVRIGKEEDNLVVDGRVGFHFIPKSVKIFLDVEPRVGAERIFKELRADEPHRKNVKEVEEGLKKRMNDDRKRYKKYYRVDFLNKAHYDLVVDTTRLNKKGVADRILVFVKRFKKK